MSEEIAVDSMNPQQIEREARRAQANRGDLVERIARIIRQDGRLELLKGLHLNSDTALERPALPYRQTGLFVGQVHAPGSQVLQPGTKGRHITVSADLREAQAETQRLRDE